MRILVLLTLTLSRAYCGAYVPNGSMGQNRFGYTVHNGGKCEYSVSHLNYIYSETERTFDPSPIDPALLRAALMDSAEDRQKTFHWIRGSDSTDLLRYALDTMPPEVIQSIHFEDAPKFTLLRYQWYYYNYLQVAYVAHFEDTGDWYVLDNGEDCSSKLLIDSYNGMMSTHREDLAGLCLECKAALLVSILHAAASPVFVASNYADILIAQVWFDYYYGAPFVLTAVGDTLIVPNDLLKESILYGDIDGVGLDTLGIVKAIQKCGFADKTTVCLSVYDDRDATLTPWCVVFSNEGDLLAIAPTKEATYVYSVDYRRYAGYMFNEMVDTSLTCEQEER